MSPVKSREKYCRVHDLSEPAAGAMHNKLLKSRTRQRDGEGKAILYLNDLSPATSSGTKDPNSPERSRGTSGLP